MSKPNLSFDSLCVHDFNKAFTTMPHQLPIYATASFEFENINQGIDVFDGKIEGHVYGRYGNPTIESVANKIASLEAFGSDLDVFGMMTSSGMSAITTLLIGLFKQGDKIVTQSNLYGGTTELLDKIFRRQGLDTIFVDMTKLEALDQLLKNDKSIKGIYLETPANPTLACVDLSAIAKIAKQHEVITMIDNTFATPYLQQPLLMGIDLIIHSTTKYLNGHGNCISGIIVGKKEFYDRLWYAMKISGTNCNPFDAWLVNIGIKTLSLRMDKHCHNATKLAQYLEAHPQVQKVNYIGLESHPDHELAKRQMKGFGGMLSFEVKGGLEAGISFMNKIDFCTLAPTLGDVDTLIVHPASMSHKTIPEDIRRANGISDGLVRISVGIEDYQDIKTDITSALN